MDWNIFSDIFTGFECIKKDKSYKKIIKIKTGELNIKNWIGNLENLNWQRISTINEFYVGYIFICIL